LAGETAGDDVGPASPLGAVEGSNVIVNLSKVGKPSVSSTRLKHRSSVRVDLDGTDRSVAQQQVGEQAAAAAGEQVQRAHQPPHSRGPRGSPRPSVERSR
jgi:hypothetical protein